MNQPGFAAQVDWLTIASYKFKSYTQVAAWVRSKYGTTWKRSKWLQYEGFTNGSIFYGKAQQTNKEEHYIVKVSGLMASDFLTHFRQLHFADTFYCTRIDIQRTIPRPVWWIPREVKDAIHNEGVVCSMVESDTGSTVYIGSRSSGRFVRLYEKDMSKAKFVRLEIELKGGHSRNAYDYILDGATVASVYGSHLYKLDIPGQWVADYLPGEYDDLDLTLAQNKSDMEKRMKWLRTLIPTFQKMLNDHSIGYETKSVFESLLSSMEDTEHDNSN